jgi:hypothetical protein
VYNKKDLLPYSESLEVSKNKYWAVFGAFVNVFSGLPYYTMRMRKRPHTRMRK